MSERSRDPVLIAMARNLAGRGDQKVYGIEGLCNCGRARSGCRHGCGANQRNAAQEVARAFLVEIGVAEYEIRSCGDSKTCGPCSEWDGSTGPTFPPHPGCEADGGCRCGATLIDRE